MTRLVGNFIFIYISTDAITIWLIDRGQCRHHLDLDGRCLDVSVWLKVTWAGGSLRHGSTPLLPCLSTFCSFG